MLQKLKDNPHIVSLMFALLLQIISRSTLALYGYQLTPEDINLFQMAADTVSVLLFGHYVYKTDKDSLT